MDVDPLGNPLSPSVTYDDCPYEGCRMTLPHLHSLIFCGCRFLVSQAEHCGLAVCPHRRRS